MATRRVGFGAGILVFLTMWAPRPCSAQAPVRQPLSKPVITEEVVARVMAASRQAAHADRVRFGPYPPGYPHTSNHAATHNKANAAVDLTWADEHGISRRYRVSVCGELDVIVAARVRPEGSGATLRYVYSYVVTTLPGSKRDLVRLIMETSAPVLLTSSAPGHTWDDRKWSGRSKAPGVTPDPAPAMKPGYWWVVHSPEHRPVGPRLEGLEVVSRYPPGLVAVLARGYVRHSEMKAPGGRARSDDFMPDEVRQAIGELMKLNAFYRATGTTLGPCESPTAPAERVRMMRETLSTMAGLGWVGGGDVLERLQGSLKRLESAVTTGDASAIDLRKKELESLVKTNFGYDEILAEVHDFLLSHLAALDGAQPDKP